MKLKIVNMAFYGLTMRGVIKNTDNEILILKRHPKSKTDPEMWELPGGKVEKGEHFTNALIREIKEETNLDCEVGDFCEAVQNDYMHKRTVQLIMYLENIKGDVKISEEHTEFMWADLEKIRSLEISSSLKKILEKRNWEI
ncbi:NUDIX domain-containing protein [Methanobrevibacter sp.]|uniref:NUDIX domain-containing protein n=1 Tax=Methanobrevibacter sp. TaxID=66852 RepID=UPI0025E70B73|nr:NUDIX domain-containing protein [Methanobrevibacter sp.]